MGEIDPLIRRAQQGDERALRQLFERHRGDVTRIAARLLGPDAELEDVVQESFVQIFRSLPSFQGQSKLTTWIFRVVANVVRMQLRRKRSRPLLAHASDERLQREPDPGGRPDTDAERNERVRALYRHLDALSDKKRTVLVLHDLSGMAAKDIAELVEAPVMTVRTRLFYARKELLAALATDPATAELLARLQEDGDG
jgi:RNA polymerase sigma-70 factor (ECF subfamily)